MPQKQNLFPEDNISKPTEAARAYQFQNPRSELFEERTGNRSASRSEETALMMMSGTNRQTVKYFDLVTESSPAARSNGALASGKQINQNSTFASLNKKPALAAVRYFSTADSEDPQELFSILLVYLDQIVYLKEIRESLGKLDAAVSAGEIDAVNSIARSCIGAGTHCGMIASVEMLRRLERIKDDCQLPAAANLCRHIRREFENFRRNLRENLEQMAAQRRNQSRN